VFSGVVAGETISVEGVSEVSVMPDLVSVYFNVEVLDDSAEVAKNENAEIVDAVKAGLIEVGFSREDFETQNFNVREEFDWGRDEERTSLGFRASHSIVVRVDAEDEEMIGKAIDVAVDNGALLGYVNFELSQELENEYKAEALRLAAQDAKIKAEAVADGLGVRLGKVVSTDMGNGFGYYPRMAFAESDVVGLKGAEIATDIEVGEEKVRSSISVTYKLR
jgi:uncharacterized protein YggE